MAQRIRLNDAFPENFAQGSQKISETTHYESRVQSNTRADFKLTYRENYRKLQKAFLGGGGWLIASEKLMTAYLLQRQLFRNILKYSVENK